MRHELQPHLVNDRFGDPALLVEFVHARRFVLFDCGDLHAAAPEALRLVSDIFLSHAHLDHLIGFDHLLRQVLDLPRTVRVFGPSGTAQHIAAKLQGYSWNLAAGTRGGPVFIVHDFIPGGRHAQDARLEVWILRAAEKFAAVPQPPRLIDEGAILADDHLWVRAAVLDHVLPCLGFAFGPPATFHLRPDAIRAHGLKPGRWAAEVAHALQSGAPRGRLFTLEAENGVSQSWTLDRLADEVFERRDQPHFAYVTDAADSPGNRRAIVDLARGAHTLFIEAGFLDEDAARAGARSHLTAAAAGELAGAAQVSHVEPFHFSARYRGREAELLAEVCDSFERARRLVVG